MCTCNNVGEVTDKYRISIFNGYSDRNELPSTPFELGSLNKIKSTTEIVSVSTSSQQILKTHTFS